MAVEIHPIPLYGVWDIGYALDVHTIKSIPIGEDAYGHLHFDNTRSEIGELLYQFKYNGKYENLNPIVDAIVSFWDETPETPVTTRQQSRLHGKKRKNFNLR